jgi:hypothetical protein
MSGPDVFGADPYSENRAVHGELVTVLRGVSERRGLQLEAFRSRATPSGQIHELMSTDEPAEPGARVDRVALLGFFEVTSGGVLLIGSEVRVAGRLLGTLAGFNATHMPNHQNICIRVDRLQDGEAMGISIGAAVTFDYS